MGYDIEDLRVKAQIKQDAYELTDAQAAESIGIEEVTYQSFIEGTRKSHDGTLEKIEKWVTHVGRTSAKERFQIAAFIGVLGACIVYVAYGLISAVYG